jgi:hypothetical protein
MSFRRLSLIKPFHKKTNEDKQRKFVAPIDTKCNVALESPERDHLQYCVQSEKGNYEKPFS